jgi:predicted transcriptional regulator YdeE
MCSLCEDAEFGHGNIAVVSRPAHQLAGLRWTGSLEWADRGGFDSAQQTVRDFSSRRTALWKSPIVVLASVRNSADCSYFIGIVADDDEQIPAEFEQLRIDEMDFAALSLGHQGSDIVEQYSRLRAWVDDGEYNVADVGYGLREEYAHDVEIQGARPLRLMLPVVLRQR